MITMLLTLALIGCTVAAVCSGLILYDFHVWRSRERGNDLMIKIVDRSGRRQQVSPGMLKNLLASNEISKFRRASGWVKIGIDAIRSQANCSFSDQERRLG